MPGDRAFAARTLRFDYVVGPHDFSDDLGPARALGIRRVAPDASVRAAFERFEADDALRHACDFDTLLNPEGRSDSGSVPKKNFENIRPLIAKEHFNVETMTFKNVKKLAQRNNTQKKTTILPHLARPEGAPGLRLRTQRHGTLRNSTEILWVPR